ncbi:hypothetical protein ACFWP2_27595 [Kitasatospora sp. NPDC058444]|nr:hypothetical protein [Streptomyces sp. FH025]
MAANDIDAAQDVDAELAATEIIITEEELEDVSGASLPIPRLLNT